MLVNSSDNYFISRLLSKKGLKYVLFDCINDFIFRLISDLVKEPKKGIVFMKCVCCSEETNYWNTYFCRNCYYATNQTYLISNLLNKINYFRKNNIIFSSDQCQICGRKIENGEFLCEDCLETLNKNKLSLNKFIRIYLNYMDQYTDEVINGLPYSKTNQEKPYVVEQFRSILEEGFLPSETVKQLIDNNVYLLAEWKDIIEDSEYFELLPEESKNKLDYKVIVFLP